MNHDDEILKELLREAALVDDAQMAQELEELRSLQDVLEADAVGMQQILDAPHGVDVPIPPRRPLLRSPLWLRIGALTGVAAVLALVFMQDRLPEPVPPFPGVGEVLGGRVVGVSDLTPVGPHASFASFGYSSDYSSSKLLSVIRIWALGASEDQAPLIEVSFSGTQWTPPPGQSLPDEIRWELSIFDKSQKPLDRVVVPFAAR